MDNLNILPLYSGNLNDLHPNGFKKYAATYSNLINAPTVSYTPKICYIDVWSDTANIYQMIRIVGITYDPVADYCNTYIRSSHYTGSEYGWSAWEKLVTKSDLSTYYHKCIYARTNASGSNLVKTLALEDGKCYMIEGYQGDNYRRTRVYLFSGTIRTIDEITSQVSPFTLSSNGTVLTITFESWSDNQCRIYEESPANGANIR